MSSYNFWIIVAFCTDFCNIFRVSNLVQPCCDVIVKPEDKLIFFMTNSASSQRHFGNARAYLFVKGEGSVKGIVMAIQAIWEVFGMFFGLPVFIKLPMNTF